MGTPEDPADETTAHELVAASEPVEAPSPRRIAERRVVGRGTVNRLLTRRAFRPAGNSRAFWLRMEEDDPFVPGPARDRGGSPGLAPLPDVTGHATESRPPPQVRPEAPRREAPEAPRREARAHPERAPRDARAGPARPRPVDPPPSRPPAGAARVRSPDEVPRPRSAPPPAPSPPETASGRPPQAARAPEEPLDRRPPIVPVKGLPTARRSGRIRPPPSGEAPKRPAPRAPPPPRTNTIDDYVAYVSELQQLEKEYIARQAEEAESDASPSVPRRPTGGLDDLLGDTGEGRVPIPKPTRRRDDG